MDRGNKLASLHVSLLPWGFLSTVFPHLLIAQFYHHHPCNARIKIILHIIILIMPRIVLHSLYLEI